ncbi:uncharacterized protein LOC122327353 isoform X2 [Puntigrus tetrazona]|uniref:uncharacterized protein LOC122327353 isoform X2 n=1 Tax=Puntigrus tetrazona TaxID=1606681 RepID=UPI001C8980B1|nr:uncharacterized protein LOC122327353 isoform X2 [Puntigrus tetrazona]
MLRLVLFLSLAAVSGAETDKTEPVSVMEGDSITLQTNLTEILNGDTIVWMFGSNDALISQIGRKDHFTSFFVTDDVKFRDRLHLDQTGSLTIRNTRTKHAGQYKLIIMREKTTSKIFIVNVLVVVGERDGIKSLSVPVKEGDPVTLHPDAEIHKDALLLWRFVEGGILLARVDIETNETSVNNANERFRDRLELDQTGSLTIKNTRSTDSGLYELQIRGSEGLQRFFVSVIDPGPSSGVIAGIMLGVIAVLLLLAVGAVAQVHYRRRISKLQSQISEEKESVMEGKSVTLQTGLTEIQGDCTVEWCYEDQGNLVGKINSKSTETYDGADGRFRSKLSLNAVGDLTISNTRTIHSGLYKLKISSSRKPIYKKFSVTINVESVPVKEGNSVTLQTDAEIKEGDLILWTFGAMNILVIRAERAGTISVNESFKDRLELDHQTGSLTIKNTRIADSGHFKLQIINRNKTRFRRFNVTFIASTENQDNSEIVLMPLLNGDVADGGNQH